MELIDTVLPRKIEDIVVQTTLNTFYEAHAELVQTLESDKHYINVSCYLPSTDDESEYRYMLTITDKEDGHIFYKLNLEMDDDHSGDEPSSDEMKQRYHTWLAKQAVGEDLGGILEL